MKTVLLFLLLSPGMLLAQMIRISPSDVQRRHSYLIMRDGSVVKGQVIRQDSTIITIKRRDGDLSFVEADQVLRILPNRPTETERQQASGALTDQQTVFVFKDGTRIGGTFVWRDSTMMTVRKRNGQLTYFEPELLLRVDTVRAGLETGDAEDGSERVFTNRFPIWLLTGQTAFNAEKGRFYYRNTLAVLNEFDYGITRNWSIGASFITPVTYLALVNFYALNGFLPNNSRLFTKVSVPLGDGFRLGINVDYQDRPYSSINRGTLTYQVLATIGSSQRNVTVGAGLIDRGNRRYYVAQPPYSSTLPAYVDEHIPNQLFLTLGIMQKVGPGLTLISDNRINPGPYNSFYYDNSERVSLSFAFRIDRRRHAFDLGLYSLVYRNDASLYNAQVRFLPYLGYNLLIGRD
ncbi:hypothetical protein [Spirosoma spitsbergense]|uniref:hypothetical protein n=1 Tax=Spirosoma spitsbergense TaxID=431554 RepID=UPI000381B2AE|nr:hypothetical protein [Spirosoma spitsbergense]